VDLQSIDQELEAEGPPTKRCRVVLGSIFAPKPGVILSQHHVDAGRSGEHADLYVEGDVITLPEAEAFRLAALRRVEIL